MPAIERDITIEIGAVFEDEIRLKNPDGSAYDLTGCTARMQIRDEYGGLLADLSTGNGRLAIDGTAGSIRRRIGATVTAADAFKTVSKAFYDLFIIPADADSAWKLYWGEVKLERSYTYG